MSSTRTRERRGCRRLGVRWCRSRRWPVSSTPSTRSGNGAPSSSSVCPTAVHSELASVLGGGSPSTVGRLQLAARELVLAAATDGGILLVLHDLELADPPTLVLVEQWARMTRRVAVGPRRHPPGCHGAHRPGGRRTGPPSSRAHGPVRAGAARGGHRGPDPDRPGRPRRGPRPRFGRWRARYRSWPTEWWPSPWAPVSWRPTRWATASRPRTRPGDSPSGWDHIGGPPFTGRWRRRWLRRAGHRVWWPGAASFAAGDPAAAVPHTLEVARQASAVHTHAEVLATTTTVLEWATGQDRVEVLALRGFSLVAAGDPTAPRCLREALSLAGPDWAPFIRLALAQASILSGDAEGAEQTRWRASTLTVGLMTAPSCCCVAWSPTSTVTSMPRSWRLGTPASWPWRRGHRVPSWTSSPSRG